MHPRLGMVLRITVALLVATGAILLVAPRTPWDTSVAVALGSLPRRLLALAGLALAAALLPVVALRPRSTWRSAEATALAGGLLLVLEALVVLGVLAVAVAWPIPALHDLVLPPDDGPRLDFANLLVLALAPALIEEWFFRGRLLPLLDRGLGGFTAVTVSAGLFAAAHGGTAPLLFALPMGLALGWVRLRSPALYPCIFAHALHNLLALSAGGALVVAGWLPALALVSGAWLVVLGWAHHRVGDLRHAHCRFAMAASLALSAVMLLLPLHRALHDRLWTAAAGAVLTDPRCQPRVGAGRLASLDQRHLLGERRRSALVSHLLAAESAPLRHRCWLLLALEVEGPERLIGHLPSYSEGVDGPVHAVLLELVQHPDRGRVRDAIDAISARHPAETARYLRYDPVAFAEWLPLPQRAGALLALLEATTGRERDGLHRLLFRRYSPEFACAILLRLPARAVTQRDRYHLRKHHPDPESLLERLAHHDRARALAWGWEEP